MRRIGLLAQKGGTGKTTLAVHLAVEAASSGTKVLLVDIDPQASASMWWRRRQAAQPELVQSHGGALDKLLQQAKRGGYELAIIDTAPHSSDEATAAAQLCDFVYIPTRPAIFDLDAIGTSTALVAEVGAAARIVLNACPPSSRRGEPRIVMEARTALEAYRIPVCDVSIGQRAAFSHALIDGRVAAELDASGKAAAEIEQLWAHVEKELSQ